MWAPTRTLLLGRRTRQLVRWSTTTSATTSDFSVKHVKGASKAGVGPIGADGRHELWREDIYDHDNEPK